MKDIRRVFQVLFKITFVNFAIVVLTYSLGLSPDKAEAQNKKSVLCVKRGSQLSGLVYHRSSTKCLPGEKKINSVGVEGPAGEPGPTGPVAPLTVDPVHDSGTLVTSGSNVKFSTTKYLSGDISYDAGTGTITLNQAGSYLFTWQAAVDGLANLPEGYDPQTTPPYATFVLRSPQGELGAAATLPTHLGSVTGNAIIEILTAPVTVSLVNTSPWSVNLAGASIPKSTLSVTRLYTEFAPIMMSLELN